MFTKNYWLARKRSLVLNVSSDAEKDDYYCRFVNINGNNCYLRSGYGYTANTSAYSYGETTVSYGDDWGYSILYSTNVCKRSKSELIADLSKYTGSNTPPYGIYFGTGTEAPTVDDCVLHGDIVTTFKHSIVKNYGIDDSGAYCSLLFTLTNTGEGPITISEVGLLGYARSRYYSDSSRYFFDNLLFERTLLETPITIEPGGVGQVTYTIRQNFPTA